MPAQPTVQELHRGEHHQADPDNID
jgi:hypothetical protein